MIGKKLKTQTKTVVTTTVGVDSAGDAKNTQIILMLVMKQKKTISIAINKRWLKMKYYIKNNRSKLEELFIAILVVLTVGAGIMAVTPSKAEARSFSSSSRSSFSSSSRSYSAPKAQAYKAPQVKQGTATQQPKKVVVVNKTVVNKTVINKTVVNRPASPTVQRSYGGGYGGGSSYGGAYGGAVGSSAPGFMSNVMSSIIGTSIGMSLMNWWNKDEEQQQPVVEQAVEEPNGTVTVPQQ